MARKTSDLPKIVYNHQEYFVDVKSDQLILCDNDLETIDIITVFDKLTQEARKTITLEEMGVSEDSMLFDLYEHLD